MKIVSPFLEVLILMPSTIILPAKQNLVYFVGI